MEEMGYALAPSPFFSNAAAGLLIQQAGSDEQKQKWLPGSRPATSSRRSVRSRTAARRSWRTQRSRRDRAVRLRPGHVVERSAAEVEKVDTIDSTRKFASVSADGGEPLEGDVQAGLDRIATALSAELTGVAQRTMDMAVDYSKERKQFERPIGAYQAVSHRCAQMLMEVSRAGADLLRRLRGGFGAGRAVAGCLGREGVRVGRGMARERPRSRCTAASASPGSTTSTSS